MEDKETRRDFSYALTELFHSDLKILFITDDKATAVDSVSPVHVHSFWELFYVEGGGMTFAAEKEVIQVREGQLLLVPPSLYHATLGNGKTEKHSVFFSVERIKNKATDPLYDRFLAAFSVEKALVFNDGDGTGRLLKGILRLSENSDSTARWREQALMTELIFRLWDRLEKGERKATPYLPLENSEPVYKYAIERLMDLHLNRDIGLDFLSDKLCISPNALARIIRKTYGKSFQELKTELKMRNAKKLLQETQMTVGQVSQAIGYNTERGFLSAFKKYEGISPTQYRKK
ncbi:MAG: helix-turn-helix transcriptional regulator [Clostridia bacterium]|nr:helix-turn-helix transcriptional regulator [Clostridia bacterium]